MPPRRLTPSAHTLHSMLFVSQVPVTFRAAGTSLSGQAITDSVLLKLSHTGKNFRNFTVHVSFVCPIWFDQGLWHLLCMCASCGEGAAQVLSHQLRVQMDSWYSSVESHLCCTSHAGLGRVAEVEGGGGRSVPRSPVRQQVPIVISNLCFITLRNPHPLLQPSVGYFCDNVTTIRVCIAQLGERGCSLN